MMASSIDIDVKVNLFFYKGLLPVNCSDVRLNNTKLQSVEESKKRLNATYCFLLLLSK